LPDGPVSPASRWTATSNVEVGQTTCPVDRGRVGTEGREGSEGQSHKEKEKEGGSGTNEGPLVRDGGLYTGTLVEGPTEFLITPLGPDCLLIQSRFEEPVRP